MTGSGHPQYFATVIKARREQLGLTMAAVQTPAVPTLVLAEAGKLDNPQPKTFTKFDTGLRWVSGSAARAYWHQEAPVPADEAVETSSPLVAGASGIQVPLERVLALMDVQRDLNAAAGVGTDMPAAEVSAFAARIDGEVSYLVGKWATDMLERNRQQGTAHPGLEFALADALAVPVDPDDPGAEERWYRRWLLGGRQAAAVDEELHEKFEQRYQRSQQGGEYDH